MPTNSNFMCLSSDKLANIYTNCFHHMPKMADMPIYGKTPIKSPPEHTGNSLGLSMYQKFVSKFVQMMFLCCL